MPGDEWPVLRTETTFECPFFTVGFDRVERPDGELADYYWVDPWDGVSVVAETPEGELVCVEEYRPRHRRSFLSFPKGGVVDEDFASAGRRELREETGWRADHTEVVTTYHSSGWLRQTRAVVYASELTAGEPTPEEGEYIETYTLDPAAVYAKLDENPVPSWTLTPLLAVIDAGLLEHPDPDITLL